MAGVVITAAGGGRSFGWALVFTPSVASVARYFKKRRTFATGLAFTGVGLSSFAFSPLFQFLVDTYAWRGALLVVAGMSFNLVVCGALIRPLTLKEDLASPGDPGGSCLGKLSTLFGLPLLSHWPFMRFVLAVTLINTGYFIPYVHLVARARELGFDEYQAAFLMSVAAMADLCGRLLSGWLADCRAFRLSHILVAWTSLTGISLALVPLGRGYPLLMAIGVCYGFFSGALTPVVFSILPEIVGIGRIFGSMGLLQMMESIGGLLGAPFSGRLPLTSFSSHSINWKRAPPSPPSKSIPNPAFFPVTLSHRLGPSWNQDSWPPPWSWDQWLTHEHHLAWD
uniref:Monocarboxylate transporter 13 n=1 Tax=Terrapene triunguis TaxID=2587831 RepID=A0A674K3W5_9SAUR